MGWGVGGGLHCSYSARTEVRMASRDCTMLERKYGWLRVIVQSTDDFAGLCSARTKVRMALRECPVLEPKYG